MSNTLDPLLELAKTARVGHEEERPDESFLETALPGFKHALNARHAIRQFDGVPMPEDVMLDCLRDAILSPSSSNLQTYELCWVRDADRKQAVSDACFGQPASATASELVVVVARGDLWDVNRKKVVAIMTEGGAKPLADPVNDYYSRLVPFMMQDDSFGIHNLMRRISYWFKGRQGPTMRIPVNRGDHRVFAHIQATLAAQTLMLSLSAHGYESCPIGGMDSDRVAESLELPARAEVSMVIAAGRGKPEGLYGARIRLPESDLIKII